MAKTLRIELSDDDWAVMRSRMTLPMAAAINKAAQLPREGVVSAEIAPDSPLADAGRELILASVVDWSYGDVDMETLVNEVPVEDQEAIEAAAVEVVRKSPLVARISQHAGSSSAKSSTTESGARSRRSSPSRTSATSRGGNLRPTG